MMYEVLIHTLKQYLFATMSLQELEQWIVEQLQGIIDSGDRRAIDLANQIDAFFVEMGEGLHSETELKALLQGFVWSYEGQVTLTSTESTSRTIPFECGFPANRTFTVSHAFVPAVAGR